MSTCSIDILEYKGMFYIEVKSRSLHYVLDEERGTEMLFVRSCPAFGIVVDHVEGKIMRVVCAGDLRRSLGRGDCVIAEAYDLASPEGRELLREFEVLVENLLDEAAVTTQSNSAVF